MDSAGASLRAARARLGLTQTQAAHLLATSQADLPPVSEPGYL
jgi:DNA-binding XRE family transcriptional regulator